MCKTILIRRASLLILLLLAPTSEAQTLKVHPAKVTLNGHFDRQQLLVMSDSKDVTRIVEYVSSNPKLAQVNATGIVTPVGNGKVQISVSLGASKGFVEVEVIDGDRILPVTLERDVIPILTRHGCNSGACHGKQRGQNGFQLSLLGFDPDSDLQAMAQEARGRRVFLAAPKLSLLLRKPTGEMAHGGGKRLDIGSHSYEILRRWIASGLPRQNDKAPTLEQITVTPEQRLLAPQERQQLIVTAHYSDGTQRDVTHLSTFQSNESTITAVSDDGLLQAGPIPGEAAIMARFKEKFAVCDVLIPRQDTIAGDAWKNLPRHNFIDGHVWQKLQRLKILPSKPASDATFFRRVTLDLIGRLPTSEEARTFLKSTDPKRREKWIDALLQRPEYADYWAGKWADLLRPNPYRVGIKAVYTLDAWLRESFRKNKPYDQFVREILTAQGSTFRHGPTVIFRDRRSPDEITTMVSQLFLGIRLECAKCHHHPFEVYGQDDFYSFAAYFARLGRKGTGLSPPISGSEELLYDIAKGEVRHPLTGETLSPKPLYGKAPTISSESGRRKALAQWLTSKENPYFARVIVNRVWADLMGRGLVDPVDDLRGSNPPSNEALLDALAKDFVEQKFDLKELLRRITTSYVYGLSSTPNQTNVADTRNYSRHYRTRLRAEVLLDAVCDITNLPESFSAMPPASRAVELWTVRSQSIFLDTFGRPDPNQDPPCERTSDTSVTQALHLMNAEKLHRKVIENNGQIAKWAVSKKSNEEILDELYLSVYSRFPTEKEKTVCAKLFRDKSITRREVLEDILWTLINTPEFVFKD